MSAKIIAEIGCNHKGEMAIAREMITTAATISKVDIVKFQKRNTRECLSEEQYNAPHPNPCLAYGPTYGAHREHLEFDVDQHRELKALCDDLGVVYSSSVWDITSARDIISLEPELIKVPSACNLNRELLTVLCQDYPGQIHLSLGMTSQIEEEQIIALFESLGRAQNLVIYACTSGYPVAFEDICLLELTRLRKHYGDRVRAIGFSGHHLGIAADIAALTLGAEYIERHFTLDRTWRGTDQAASVEPDGMRRLARDIRNVNKSLTYKRSEILAVEEEQRLRLKASQVRWDNE